MYEIMPHIAHLALELTWPPREDADAAVRIDTVSYLNCHTYYSFIRSLGLIRLITVIRVIRTSSLPRFIRLARLIYWGY